VSVLANVGAVLNFNNFAIESYAGRQDKNGAVSIEDGGATLRLVGNLWKSIELPMTITADTVLEFDFSSSQQGEIHTIGFDNDLSLSPEFSFDLYGTQRYGFSEFRNYANDAPSTVHYRIPVGEFFTGTMQWLTFGNDHDVAGADGESVYSNIKIYDSSASVSISGSSASDEGSEYVLSLNGGEQSAPTNSWEINWGDSTIPKHTGESSLAETQSDSEYFTVSKESSQTAVELSRNSQQTQSGNSTSTVTVNRLAQWEQWLTIQANLTNYQPLFSASQSNEIDPRELFFAEYGKAVH
jgi:hypothetical protein